MPTITDNNTYARRALKSIIFIDSRIPDYQQLISQLPADCAWQLIDHNSDGLQQIADALAGFDALNTLHIISHGSDGALSLGTTTLNSNTLSQHADTLRTIGSHLAPTGDILLYGCNVAQTDSGKSFVEQLAQLTAADVAASIDTTGHFSRAGNWALESQVGGIESSAIAVFEYAGQLGVSINNLNERFVYAPNSTSPAVLDNDLSISSSNTFTNGFLRLQLASSDTRDQFTLASASNVNASGAMSVVGNVVYVGNGSGRNRIGVIDSIENGLSGQPLKILFSTPLPNGNFENGSNSWSFHNEQYGNNGNEINLNGYAVSLASNYGVGSGVVKIQTDDGMTYSGSVTAGVGTANSSALRLNSSGNIIWTNGTSAPGSYGSIHGPYATSAVFSVETGDSLSLQFKANAIVDDYEVFGLLRKVDASGNFLSNAIDTNNTLLFAERGSTTNGYVTITQGGLTAGNYRFEFVGGTYDGTGGLAVGSDLYVDDIKLLSNTTLSNAMVSSLAQQIKYQRSGAEVADRIATLTVADSSGLSASDTIVIGGALPTITSFLPLDEANRVAITSSIVVTFSETVQRGSGAISLIRIADGSMVSSSISINNNVLTIDPTVDLAYGSGYRVVFDAGSVTDLAGNAYAGSNSYNFTTFAQGGVRLGTEKNDTLYGTVWADTLYGLGGNDTLYGQGDNDLIYGDTGNDTLNGGEGNDTLVGGLGADQLTGGTGNDVFRFTQLADMGLGSNRDIITDFVRGQDTIDLSLIAVNSPLPGVQAFTKIAALSPFTAIGQVRYRGGIIEINTDTDPAPNYAIRLTGLIANIPSDLAPGVDLIGVN